MADLLTLEEVKLHCRIDDDFEDTLIQAYIAAALEVCQKHIGKRFDGDTPQIDFNPALKVGCMMFISQLYEYRTTISDIAAKEVPFAISALWSAYREPGIY